MFPVEVTHSSAKLRENRILMLRGESFSPSDFVANSVVSFKESLTGLKNYFLLLEGFKGENKTLAVLRKGISDAKDLEGLNYVVHGETLLPCPTGFQGDFYEYTEVLRNNMQEVIKVAQQELDFFTVELSQFISSKDIKLSIKDNGAKVDQLNKWRSEKAKELAPFFSNGSNQRLKMSHMFPNRTAIVGAAKNAAEAFTFAEAADPRKFKRSVDEITMRIESVISLAESKEDINISPEALRNIAEKSYAIGRVVELLANYSTQSETAAVISSHILDRVIPLSK